MLLLIFMINDITYFVGYNTLTRHTYAHAKRVLRLGYTGKFSFESFWKRGISTGVSDVHQPMFRVFRLCNITDRICFRLRVMRRWWFFFFWRVLVLGSCIHCRERGKTRKRWERGEGEKRKTAGFSSLLSPLAPLPHCFLIRKRNDCETFEDRFGSIP